MSAIHASIVQRACDVLLWHPQCPPIGDQTEGTQGLAFAMEAALEAVRDDLADAELAETRRHLEATVAQLDDQDAWTSSERDRVLAAAREHLAGVTA